MARSASRERLSKLHRGETTRVYPIWRAARELTVVFGPTVSFINASYGYYRPFIPVSTREEGEREYRLTPRADEDIQAQAKTSNRSSRKFPTKGRYDHGAANNFWIEAVERPLLAYPFTNQRGPSNNRGDEGSSPSRFTAY